MRVVTGRGGFWGTINALFLNLGAGYTCVFTEKVYGVAHLWCMFLPEASLNILSGSQEKQRFFGWGEIFQIVLSFVQLFPLFLWWRSQGGNDKTSTAPSLRKGLWNLAPQKQDKKHKFTSLKRSWLITVSTLHPSPDNTELIGTLKIHVLILLRLSLWLINGDQM